MRLLMELGVDSKLFWNIKPAVGIIGGTSVNFSTSDKSLFIKVDTAIESKVPLFSHVESLHRQALPQAFYPQILESSRPHRQSVIPNSKFVTPKTRLPNFLGNEIEKKQSPLFANYKSSIANHKSHTTVPQITSCPIPDTKLWIGSVSFPNGGG